MKGLAAAYNKPTGWSEDPCISGDANARALERREGSLTVPVLMLGLGRGPEPHSWHLCQAGPQL